MRSQNLRKAMINLVMSVSPFVIIEQPVSKRTDFREIYMLVFCLKISRENSSFMKILQELWVFYVKTYIPYIYDNN
jgi:hypothetical protein